MQVVSYVRCIPWYVDFCLVDMPSQLGRLVANVVLKVPYKLGSETHADKTTIYRQRAQLGLLA